MWRLDKTTHDAWQDWQLKWFYRTFSQCIINGRKWSKFRCWSYPHPTSLDHFLILHWVTDWYRMSCDLWLQSFVCVYIWNQTLKLIVFRFLGELNIFFPFDHLVFLTWHCNKLILVSYQPQLWQIDNNLVHS